MRIAVHRTNMRRRLPLVLTLALAFVTPHFANADDLPKTHLKVVGSWGTLSQFKTLEGPFWLKEVPEKSKGAITADVTPYNEMGLKGAEVFRLMRLGVIDFGTTTLGYVAGDDARNEAIDLAGLSPDIETARKVSEAYKPIYEKFYKENFGIKVLGIWPYPAQVLFCNTKIGSLADLKGKKVRTANRTLAEFVEAVGGTGVTLSFGEVVPALQNKVVDCAITGSLSGNTSKYYEVASHIYALPLGWSQAMQAVNEKTWNKLDPRVRDFLLKEFKNLENRIWDYAALESREGFDCNVGKNTCKLGTKANMTLVPVSETDKILLNKILREVVVPKWAARCPGDCPKNWNETVGKIVNIQAPTK